MLNASVGASASAIASARDSARDSADSSPTTTRLELLLLLQRLRLQLLQLTFSSAGTTITTVFFRL